MWDTLKKLSITEPHHEASERLLSPLASSVFERLVLLAMSNGLLPLLAAHCRLAPSAFNLLPLYTYKAMQDQLDHWIELQPLYVKEAARIQAALATNSISFAFTKGIVGHRRWYEALGSRVFYDIDLMTPNHHSVKSILSDLGYTDQMRVTPDSQGLVKRPPAYFVRYRLSPDHLPPFVRLNNGTPPSFRVDVAMSFTWHRSGWAYPIEAALSLATLTEVGDHLLRALSPVDDFIFIALHLFREAWFYESAAWKDVRLSQFADIYRAWERLSEKDRLTAKRRVRDADFARAIAWITYHTDMLYGCQILNDLDLSNFGDSTWLRSIRGVSGEAILWDGDMNRRLEHRRIFTEGSELP